jgi:hypothetical protein
MGNQGAEADPLDKTTTINGKIETVATDLDVTKAAAASDGKTSAEIQLMSAKEDKRD